MKTKTSKWFETKIQFDKTQKDGTQKKVTEQYVVEAISFTEAEAKIIAETKDYVSGDYSVKNITPANYHEIFFGDDGRTTSGTRPSSSLSPSTRRRRKRSARTSATLFKAAQLSVRKRTSKRP